MSDLDALEKKIAAMSDEERRELSRELTKETKKMVFIPNPGPQTQAYFSEADVLLYGGSVGGGKSALGLGLALNEHYRSLVVREHFSDTEGLIDTCKKLAKTKEGFVGGTRPKYNKDNGGVIHFAGLAEDGSIGGHQGIDHDFLYVDEAANIPEKQIRLLMGWLRTDRPNQRTRVVLGSNPPLDSTGDWLLKFFGPWLDPTYPNPAKPGEIRYFLPDEDGNDFECEKGAHVMLAGVKLFAQSRSFIPSRFTDNPYYNPEEYSKTLSALDKSVREILISGNFLFDRPEGLWQLIPRKWVDDAVKRWHTHKPAGVPMSCVGVDIAQGGCFDDKTEILTNQGWKYFEDLSGAEKVLTLDDNIAKWGDITAIHKYAFNGKLNVKESSRVNFAITDNHNLIAYRTRGSQRYAIERYDELPKMFWMKKHNDWVGENEKEITFVSSRIMPNGGERKKVWKFSMLDWAEFLGWFVSEGCVVRSKVDRVDDKICIAQNPGEKMNRISELLKRMGIKAHFGKKGHDINFVNSPIGRHLKEHCGYLAKNKRVPEYIKNATTEVIDRFLESYRMGDGTKGKGGQITYMSSSKLLIDDVQEMLCKVGRAGKFSKKVEAGSVFYIGDRKVVRKNDVYALYESRNTTSRTKEGQYKDSHVDKNTVKKVPYDGYVYCVSTPLRTIMVRRMGVPMWSGNSDATVVARRFGGWFDRLVEVPGKDTPEGKDIAALVVKYRRDACPVVLDMGGGYGGSAREQLESNGIKCIPFKGTKASTETVRGSKIGFPNERSAAYWNFRNALDPSQPGGSRICLPDDQRLISELCTPEYRYQNNKYKVETKEEVVSRLGRSTDYADAIIYCWYGGDHDLQSTHPSQGGSAAFRPVSKVILGHPHQRRPTRR